jgi:hypothetical protein
MGRVGGVGVTNKKIMPLHGPRLVRFSARLRFQERAKRGNITILPISVISLSEDVDGWMLLLNKY